MSLQVAAISRSFQLRSHYFVEDLTAAFEAGVVVVFADFTDVNEVKGMSARKAGQGTKASPRVKCPRDRDACFLILGNCQMLPTR